MGDRTRLKGRIILRFISIMLLVSISEYAVMAFINIIIMPLMCDFFFPGTDIEDVRTGGIIIILLLSLAALIVTLISYLIPDQMQLFTSKLTDGINSLMQSILYRGHDTVRLSSPHGIKRIMLLIAVLGLFILAILPFIAGALVFTGMVMREFNAVEETDRHKEQEDIRMRNLMLTDIAHDLRTPMTTVSGYAKALSDGLVPDDKKEEYLEAIRNKSARMDELIGLLFDYTKLENEGFTLNRSKTDICELVRECAAGAYTDIENAGMNMDADIPEECIEINADRLQMSRVISNLIVNAVRHNKAGTTIGIIVRKDGTRNRIIVADTGDMIDEETAKHLFTPFYTGDTSRSNTHRKGVQGGTGLGLSIAYKVTALHGYTIKLRQRPDTSRYNISPEYNKAFIITT